MTKARLLVVVALLVVWPRAAHAESGLIEYLEQWSGPGPYISKPFFAEDFRVTCRSAAGAWISIKNGPCLNNQADIKQFFLVGFALGKQGERVLFADDPSDKQEVATFTLRAAYMYRINPVLDVGPGIQAVRYADSFFGSNRFSFWRVGPSIRVHITPLGIAHKSDDTSKKSLARRMVYVQFEDTWVPVGMSGGDFHNSVTKFDSGKEFQTRLNLTIDIPILLKVAFGK